MPNTRKKIIKTVYKDEDDSEADAGDFSDSGSDAKISDDPSSEDDEEQAAVSSGDEFKKAKKNPIKQRSEKKPKFAKPFISKLNKQLYAINENENLGAQMAPFSVKDLTEEDKLLPAVLNLSDSDSSDDESERRISKLPPATSSTVQQHQNIESDDETQPAYKDVFTNNIQDDSEEIARKTFLELEQHKSIVEEAKASIQSYVIKNPSNSELNVKDLLAQGGEIALEKTEFTKKLSKIRRKKDDSDSEMEDWEEVTESKPIPQQGLQLLLDIPELTCRKTKKIDVEMMMKRKINRVKKEYQVYMHKVHVLCWLGHGNYLSKVLNDQELLAAALSLVPSKDCYPGERVDMKYLEHITTWFKDKFTLKQDRNENKFRPKAPPLKEILTGQIKNRVVTAKKYLVYVFVCMLRALGLQCRVMLNFVTLPIKPPHSELCSLSTKPNEDKKDVKEKKKTETNPENKKKPARKSSNAKSIGKISQVDGIDDESVLESESSDEFENIAQLDGSDDVVVFQPKSTRSRKKKEINIDATEGASPPKKARNCPSPNTSKTEAKSSSSKDKTKPSATKNNMITKTKPKLSAKTVNSNDDSTESKIKENNTKKMPSPRKTRSNSKSSNTNISEKKNTQQQPPLKRPNKEIKLNTPKIVVTKDKEDNVASMYFADDKTSQDRNKLSITRKRAKTANHMSSLKEKDQNEPEIKQNRTRTKSNPGTAIEKSKYFNSDNEASSSQTKKPRLSARKPKGETNAEDQKRVSHRDRGKTRSKTEINITGDLVDIIKGRIKEAKVESRKGIVKEKIKKVQIEEDSDYLTEEETGQHKSGSDDDFKPTKISPKASSTKKIDRRVISTSDEDNSSNKTDVWCEVFVEELEQWISVDVIKGKVHCAESIYKNCTQPVCYVVGWDNNNYLKDLTRRYVPHWNTVTRKQRAEGEWWGVAIQPWVGRNTAKDREEDEQLDRMQLEAPLPKSIAEYKNHPLYALKRHLLKFEAIYPPDAAALGFVRKEAVYARDCVYTCRSRDTWLKEAKVVRLKEEPYKIVKARPKWDKLSNKVISDKMVEIFGPWQVQDYEPPVAENGIVPRNAYGNVELFKDCMLPKGTVHIKLPGLNKVARKLNIDCAPAMTGFDFNGGWSHPVYDGFVVCTEYEQVITEAWVQDQEDQERKEREKIESRVYGNWRRLIKGLFIRERLKNKYGFDEPTTSQNKKSSKGPRLVVKKGS